MRSSKLRTKCLDCGTRLETKASRTKKILRSGAYVPNPNFGRSYHHCPARGCKYFRWLDGPTEPIAGWPDCVTEDLLKRAAKTACRAHDQDADDPDQFTSAGFSAAFCSLTGLKGPVDGGIVTAILLGRWWIEPQEGGCHWRVVEDPADCQECCRYLDELSNAVGDRDARLGSLKATYDDTMARWSRTKARLNKELRLERRYTGAAEEAREVYLAERDEARTKVKELESILGDYQDQDHIGATTQEHEAALKRIEGLKRALDQQTQQQASWAENETRQLKQAKQKLEDLTLGLPDCFEDLVREIKRLRAGPRDLAIPEYRTMLHEAREQRDAAQSEIRWALEFDQIKNKSARERLQRFLLVPQDQQDDDPEPLI